MYLLKEVYCYFIFSYPQAHCFYFSCSQAHFDCFYAFFKLPNKLGAYFSAATLIFALLARELILHSSALGVNAFLVIRLKGLSIFP